MAYYFNGATHQIIRSDAVVGTWPITMHGRIRLPSIDLNDHFILGLFESGGGRGFYLRTASAGGTQKARMGARDGSTNASATSSTSLTAGQWHSVVGDVISATNRSVWIDNGGVGSNIVSVSPSTLVKTSIGSNDSGGTLDGNVGHELADVALWSGTLSSEERTALAAGVSPALIRPDILELYVPLIRGGMDQRGGVFTVNNATVADHPRVFMPFA
jgi:hypothetical protein